MADPDIRPLPGGTRLVHVGDNAESSLLRSALSGHHAVDELLTAADAHDVAGTVARVGADRLHVVVTMRPLDQGLAARWRRHVCDGGTAEFSEWLGDELATGSDGAALSSVQTDPIRHWSDAIGPQRVTVVVVDDDDPAALARALQRLLGLSRTPEAPSDRTLAYPETELVRRLNRLSRERGWSAATYDRYVRNGVLPHLLQRMPAAAEHRIAVPAWAGPPLESAGAEVRRTIAALGVGLVGDPHRLVPQAEAGGPEPVRTTPRAGALAMVGAIAATSAGPEAEQSAHRRVGDLSTTDLLGLIARRLRRRPRDASPAMTEGPYGGG